MEKNGAAQRAVEIIRNRIDELGVKEPVIQPQGQNRILVQLPGVVDREKALNVIGKTALLEFRLVVDDPKIIERNTETLQPQYEWKNLEDRKLLVEKEPVLTGKALADAKSSFGSGLMQLPEVEVEFSPEGSKKFAEITEKNTDKRLAIILDGKIKSAPVIREPILSGKARITGDFTPEEAATLALVLRSGALPCPLEVEEERTVGPLLGIDSIQDGIKATLLGGACVALFMLIYYLIAGGICIFALIFNLVLILGALSALGATLTLPGIAGIILTVGMAVDANVLIYERIREELHLKKPLSIALRLGYDKAFKTILDSNLTTLIAAVFLFIFGTGPIKGFGVTLSLGILASMFTALIFTRVIFEFLVSRNILRNLIMFRIVKNPQFDFINKGKFFIFISAIIIVAGGVFFAQKGESAFGIDFTGGQIQEYKFKGPVDLETLRKQLSRTGLKDFDLYEYPEDNTIGIKSSADTYAQVKTVLEDGYPAGYDIMRVEKVGPVVGRLLRNKAIFAVIFAITGILIYVVFRFKHFEFGIAAIIALFHDVLIAMAIVLFFSYKIDLLVVTALLTIAGYSINDTIVIYDRIRELTHKMTKEKLPQIINAALNQTLSRTIITSFTTLIIVFCLLVFGSQNLNGFSACLLAGVVSGTYSSIYIASPLVILFNKKIRKA